MKPITGSASIIEQPDTLAPAAPPHTHFGVAENLMPGVTLLAQGPTSASPALAFLCAHVLECVLKAYLAKVGVSDAVLEKDPATRHNIDALWALAASHGLRFHATPPDWASRLSSLHNSPYYLRYSKGVHALASPPAEPMASELKVLLEVVREQLR